EPRHATRAKPLERWRRTLATPPQEFVYERSTNAEIDRAAIHEPSLDVLTDEQPWASGCDLANAADQELPVLPDFDLLPAPRFSRLVRAGSVFGDQALVPSGFHQLPGLEAIGRQAPDGKDQLGAVHRCFKSTTTLMQGARTEISVADPQT